ncbi:integrin [Saccharospirillum alexandrii]|uniref:integrin n=1 Tax=Saccharospirillum alexandrii TaxID=2448477 RepID=UPI0013DF40CD|nr:integrin [Saccharospirillum alexandrii]
MPMRSIAPILSFALLALLGGCNSSSSENNAQNGNADPNPGTDPNTDPSTDPTAPAAAEVSLSFDAIKTLRIDWTDVEGATHYILLENPDGQSGFSPLGDPIAQGTETLALEIPTFSRFDAEYILQSCNEVGCVDASTLTIDDGLNDLIGYMKPSDVHQGSNFGDAVSLSADGSTMAVGAANARAFIDGSGDKVGTVYVFTKTGPGQWTEQQRLQASNPGNNDTFGAALSLSADGNTLAVGAKNEDSDADGIGGDETNNDAANAGAAYVFTRADGVWSNPTYIKANNSDSNDKFGESVELNDAGTVLAIGAPGEQSNDGIINGEQNNEVNNAGAVYVFNRDGDTWQQQDYIKASDATGDEFFGRAISLDSEGTTLAVAAQLEDSGETGVNGDPLVGGANKSGAAYVFVHDGANWTQQAFIKASNTEEQDLFGDSISISGDGDTLAVGTIREDSAVTGIDGDQSNNEAPSAGAVYVFTRTDADWAQQAYLKASNTDAGDSFGSAVSLSHTGDVLVVGAVNEASTAVGIKGNEFDNTNPAGAAYVFRRTGQAWTQHAYLKATNTDSGDSFGNAVTLSGDGETLAIAARTEGGNATGTQASAEEQADNSRNNRGVVYLY